MSDVLVVGSINIDTMIQVDRIPEMNEISMGTGQTYVGGRGANQAVSAARVGSKVSIIASLGTDNYGEIALNSLKEENIDISHVFYERSSPTGVAQITVDKHGNRVITLSQGANQYLSKDRIDECEDLIRKAKIVLIQCEIPHETIEEVIYLARKNNVKIILDNSPVRYFGREILNMLDYIVVSEIGFNKMTGKTACHIESIEKAKREIADTTFIIIQNHRQVLVVSKDETKLIKAPHIEPIDKTGCTGVLCGTLGAFLSQDIPFYDALQFSTAAMALSTGKFGAQSSIPYKLNVEAFLQSSHKEEQLFMNQKIKKLKETAKKIRVEIIKMLDKARSGHPGGSLSATEIVTTLFFEIMRYNSKDPLWEDRDRFVLSKGHACPVLYAALALAGFFDKKHLQTFRQINSILQGHPDKKRTPGVEVSTGSLGQGLSMANGMALTGKLLNKDFRVFCLLSDGELEEGQVWEAAMTSGFRKLDNLCAIVDFNGIQLSSTIVNVKSTVEPIGEKFLACGWNVINIDGYDIQEILAGLHKAEKEKGKPTVLIASTLKGRGVSFMERNVNYHGTVPSHEECEKAIKEILSSGV